MASIGYGKLKCEHPGCRARRPYWSAYCKLHRIEHGVATKQDLASVKSQTEAQQTTAH